MDRSSSAMLGLEPRRDRTCDRGSAGRVRVSRSVVLAAGLVGGGGGARRRRREQHIVPAGRAEEGERSRSRSRCGTRCRATNGDTLQKLTDKFNASQSRREGEPRQPDRLRGHLHEVQGRPRRAATCPTSCSSRRRSAADDRHADRAAGERVRQGRQVQLRRLPAPRGQLLHRAGHAVRDAVQHVGPGPLLQQEGVHRRRASIPRSRRRRSTTCAPRPRS